MQPGGVTPLLTLISQMSKFCIIKQSLDVNTEYLWVLIYGFFSQLFSRFSISFPLLISKHIFLRAIYYVVLTNEYLEAFTMAFTYRW